jgi:hypothetical protein
MLKCDVCRKRFWEINVTYCPGCENDVDDGVDIVKVVPDSQLSLDLLQRKYGYSKGKALYREFQQNKDGSEREYSDLDTLPFEELPVFEIATGEIAVGDPVMGMVEYDVSQFEPGFYRPRPGAFTLANADQAAAAGLPLIRCDSVYVIVVDASQQEQLAADFEEELDVAVWASCLDELSQQLGVKAAIYWSGDLVGEYVEASYLLNVSMLSRAA